MAIDMYLTLPTSDIAGESTRAGHEGEIEVIAWSFGGANPTSLGVGGGGGAGTVALNELTITKYLDASSAELFQAMCLGEHFQTAKMTAYKSGGAAAVAYLTLEFEQLYPTGLSSGGSMGEDVFTESVTFSFAKVIVTYTEQGPDGTAGGDHVGSWNILTGEPE